MEWLIKRGHFNGHLDNTVSLVGEECKVEVALTDYGLPLRIDE
jgi:hypothetical protein